MKIIFLNAWYGERQKEIIDFVNEQKETTDIFCFQESSELLQLALKKILEAYNNSAIHKRVTTDLDYFQSTFVRKGLEIYREDCLFEGENTMGLESDFEIGDSQRRWHVGNFQGYPRPGNKLDTPERLEQSRRIIERFSQNSGAKIIGGDFNLERDTESVQMFEKAGYRNLIKEFKVTTTRNRWAWEKFPDTKQNFADYVFVSPEIKIKRFEVPYNEISDHLPLLLEIED